MNEGNHYLEFIKLSPNRVKSLAELFKALEAAGELVFFSPHAGSESELLKISNLKGKDLYYLLLEGNETIGYGLLRGWDEGYEVPSLGIAIHPKARGRGLGELLMHFLHAIAIQRKAKKIRLRVNKDNKSAFNLYTRLGYKFEEDKDKINFLIGVKILSL